MKLTQLIAKDEKVFCIGIGFYNSLNCRNFFKAKNCVLIFLGPYVFGIGQKI